MCRELGTTQQTFYRWKSKYGGMEVSEAKRLKQLEDENRRLKSMVADLSLDNQALKAAPTKMVKPAALRRAAGFVMAEFKTSARRACRILGLPRSSWAYRSRPPPATELVAKLRELADARPKAGYRMLWRLLRKTTVVNHKRIYRIYREEGIAVRRKRRRRRAAIQRAALPPATRPNERWSMDFVHDRT